uniref:Uncharacterized protein n=1 Tax=mine drainage metagenome TaxID=410659 RepID=E6QDG8_9ZZZZ
MYPAASSSLSLTHEQTGHVIVMHINIVGHIEEAFGHTNPFPGWIHVYRHKLSYRTPIPGNHDFALFSLLNGLYQAR